MTFLLPHSFPSFVPVDDRVAIGYETDSNIRGTIATADIPAETAIMHIPKSLIIGGDVLVS